jgi:putative NADPH-quinone reductase
MARRIVVIQGHPDPDGRRLCRALAGAYVEGARRARRAVAEVDIAALDFPLLRTQADFEHGTMPGSLMPARRAILEAEHVVLVFPLWLGTMPALMKAFLEQVMRPDTAFAYRDRGFPKKLLAGRSARLVVTMGMPAFLYRWWYMAHGLKGLERSILGFAGISPVRETLFGMVGAAGEAKRRRWLERMRKLGERGA